jgi:hypothetical protein
MLARIGDGENGGKVSAAVMRNSCSRGESFEGSCATGKGPGETVPFAELSIQDRQRGEPHGRQRGATYPQVVDAAQTVVAGRNGKGGTCSKGGSFEPKVEQSLDCPTGSGRAMT